MSAGAGARMARGGRRYVVGSVARYAALIVAAVLFLIPFYLLVRNAFMTQAEIVGAGVELGAGAVEPGQPAANCSPTRPCRWRAALLNSVLVSVVQTVGGAGGLGARRLRAGADPLPVEQSSCSASSPRRC